MREFKPNEVEILQALVAVSAAPAHRLDQFLETVFFSERHERALILQPVGNFGYYYLKPSVFDDPQARGEQVARLIELMMLLVYLREHRYVIVNGAPPEMKRQMRFIGGLFRDPKPGKSNIVLNERGDYTFEPTVICDRTNAIIYKGVRLEADLYDLVARDVAGLFYVSPALKALLPPPPQPVAASADAAPVLGAASTPGAALTPEPHAPAHGRLARWWPAYAAALAAAAWLLYGGAVNNRWFADAATPASGEPAAVGTSAHAADAAPSARTAPAVTPAAAAPPAPAPAPSPPASERTEYYGVDLSRWNAGAIESALGTSSIDFVFVRATYGQGTDVDFTRNWSLLQQHDVIRGAYHFYLVHDDPIEQIEHYLSVVGDREPLEMPPAVDFEELSFPPRATPPDAETVRSALLSALEHLEMRTQRVPILYTNVSVGNAYLDARFARYPLWIADWTSRDRPTLPEAWKSVGYRFWQRSAQYTLSGASGPVDYDLFTGRRDDLYR